MTEETRVAASGYDPPLKVAKATKERIHLSAEEMFGNRRWVLDKDGRLVERHGLSWDGDSDAVVRTVTT